MKGLITFSMLLACTWTFGQSTPVITEVKQLGNNTLLTWINTDGVPNGGFDLVIDGSDTNSKNRTQSLSAEISTKGKCFQVEARYKKKGNNTFLRSEERCVGFYTPSVPVLTSVQEVEGKILLKWENEVGIPSGGFDVFLDGVDSGQKNRINALETIITTTARCFHVEARYEDKSPAVFEVSDKKCLPPPPPSKPVILSLKKVEGAVTVEWQNLSGLPQGGFDLFLDGEDQNEKYRTNTSQTTLSTEAQCFNVEARYTDRSPSLFEVSEKKCLPPIPPSKPIIKSIEVVDGKLKVVWENASGLPRGGFDIFLDGVDTNTKHRTTKLEAILNSDAQCIRIEARYTDKSPSLFEVSDEKCVEPVQKIFSKDEQLRKGGFTFVTDFGAIPNDGLDDTKAINEAIRSSDRTLYFPEGIYDISDTLFWKDEKDSWRSYLTIWGAGKDKTIFRLKSNTPGFRDAGQKKALFYVANHQPLYPSSGSGNNGFRNNFRDLSIVIEEGNPGAVGIDYLGNNICSIRNVALRAKSNSGAHAIDMSRYATGPCLFKDIEIEGFDIGLYYDKMDYSLTVENLKLRHQRSHGIVVTSNVLTIRSLDAQGPNPVIDVRNNHALLTVFDSTFDTQGAEPTIRSKGRLLLQNISSRGETLTIKDEVAGKSFQTKELAIYTSDTLLSPNGKTLQKLDIDILNTPPTPEIDPKEWALVDDFGAKGNGDDDWAPIQAALNSGKPVVYLGNKIYYVSKSLDIPAHVKVFYGFESRLRPTGLNFSGKTFFNIKKRSQPLFIENFDLGKFRADYPELTWFADASENSVVIRDSQMRGGTHAYQNSALSSKNTLFIENMAGGKQYTIDSGMRMFARQLNIESDETDIINDGSQVFIMGFKKEKISQMLDAKNGAITEIIGGFIYPLAELTSQPLLVLDSSSKLKVSYTTSAYKKVLTDQGYFGDFQIHLKSPEGKIEFNQIPRRSYGSIVNFMSH